MIGGYSLHSFAENGPVDPVPPHNRVPVATPPRFAQHCRLDVQSRLFRDGKMNLRLIARNVFIAARRDSVQSDADSAYAPERHPPHRSDGCIIRGRRAIRQHLASELHLLRKAQRRQPHLPYQCLTS
jgi:hypothetical protein